MSESTTFRKALDQIWTSEAPRLEVAKQVSLGLSEADLSLLREIERRFVSPNVNGSFFSEKKLPNLLAALQVARDHSDGMAFLPASERDERMNEYSSSLEVDVASFRQLCASWPQIERLIDSWGS